MAISQAMNNEEVVDNVPAPGVAFFLAASEPANARVGMASQKRPINMAKAPKKL